jgi:hypothetical protein
VTRTRGIEPTGRRIDVMCMTSLAVVAGRVADLSVVTDSLATAEQVGAVRPVAATACQVYDAGATSSRR